MTINNKRMVTSSVAFLLYNLCSVIGVYLTYLGIGITEIIYITQYIVKNIAKVSSVEHFSVACLFVIVFFS